MGRKFVNLTERFMVPPFSVLDTRADYWRKRKAAWLRLGIKSELGRGDVMPSGEGSAYSGSSTWSGSRGGKRQAQTLPNDIGQGALVNKIADSEGYHDLPTDATASFKNQGKLSALQRNKGGLAFGSQTSLNDVKEDMSLKEYAQPGLTYRKETAALDYYRVIEGDRATSTVSGTSIFDPVLCELAYTWFAPPNSLILDPFAGGSVRGIVASALGHRYVGVDLSGPQIEANREQWQEIGPELPGCKEPRWFCGDSRDIPALLPPGGTFDFVFSCPPYFDLELYSSDPKDISTMSYSGFITAYTAILKAATDRLKQDRFACIVISNVRDKSDGEGFYHSLHTATITIMRQLGLLLYNDAVLINAVGSLPVRIGIQFDASRKLGRDHQNVLVFVKGSARAAAIACGAGVDTRMVHASESRGRV